MEQVGCSLSLVETLLLCQVGHLNPAVSFAFLLGGSLSIDLFIGYVVGSGLAVLVFSVLV